MNSDTDTEIATCTIRFVVTAPSGKVVKRFTIPSVREEMFLALDLRMRNCRHRLTIGTVRREFLVPFRAYLVDDYAFWMTVHPYLRTEDHLIRVERMDQMAFIVREGAEVVAVSWPIDVPEGVIDDLQKLVADDYRLTRPVVSEVKTMLERHGVDVRGFSLVVDGLPKDGTHVFNVQPEKFIDKKLKLMRKHRP